MQVTVPTPNGENEDHLRALLKLIDEICKRPGNEWFANELGEKYLTLSSNVELYPKESISRIYEYCIEDIIKQQAESFYEDFVFSDCKDRLTQDFVRMEHNRRRNELEDFSLCVFQQIEYITNYVFEKIKEELVLKANQKAYYNYDKATKTWSTNDSSESIESVILKFEKKSTKRLKQLFYSENSSDCTVTIKMRSVLYYSMLNETGKEYPIKIKYDNFTWELYQLYQVRNKNHRGGVIDNDVIPNRYFYKFYGLLVDFVDLINKRLQPSPTV